MPHKRTREHVGRGRPRRLHVNKPLFFFFFLELPSWEGYFENDGVLSCCNHSGWIAPDEASRQQDDAVRGGGEGGGGRGCRGRCGWTEWDIELVRRGATTKPRCIF